MSFARTVVWFPPNEQNIQKLMENPNEAHKLRWGFPLFSLVNFLIIENAQIFLPKLVEKWYSYYHQFYVLNQKRETRREINGNKTRLMGQ